MSKFLSRLLLASVFGFALTAAARASSDNLLLNGDFSDGKTHWHGDGDVSDVGGKLIVTLKPDKWTAVYQDFSGSCTTAQLKITYQYSDDCTLGRTDSDAPIPPLTHLGLEEATGLDNAIYDATMSKSEQWMVLIVSGGWAQWQSGIYRRYDNGNNDGTRTFSEQISQWNGNFNRDDLCLAFPPGQGTVTISEVQLIPPAK